MSIFQNRASVAYSKCYFDALRRLPLNVMKDVNNFLEKFTFDPASKGLNYEKIQCIDGTLRSARVNKAYRAIIRIPQESMPNVYTLLWVDSHDEAYEWAAKKRLTVNPVTNAIEIFDVMEKSPEVELPIPVQSESKFLFTALTDEHLKTFGVPENLFFVMRRIKNNDELTQIQCFLPEGAFEALSFVAEGISLSEVLELAMDGKTSSGKSLSFEEAVLDQRNADKFYVVDPDDQEGLAKAISGGLESWRIFLHPSQRTIAERNFNGPARVTGGAGTGKTVVAMHRAKWLAENVCTAPGDKILFTTFTKNLADDISKSLKKLCSPSQLAKIEVINLDKWISNRIHSFGIKRKLIFGDELKNLWIRAIKEAGITMDLTVHFYMEEYEKVILANEIDSFDDYQQVKRVGRGTALNRNQKQDVWKVIDNYINLLKASNAMDIGTASMVLRKKIVEKGSEALYRSIIIDEGQDFGEASYKLIRAVAGPERDNDIFIVGDAHQRIYGKKVVLKQCGIDTIGRSGSLKINYRTTDEIQNFALSILGGTPVDDLDGGIDEGKGYLSLLHGPRPRIITQKSQQEEHSTVMELIREWSASGIELKQICIVARTAKLLENVKQYLAGNGISTYEIKNTNVEDEMMAGVRIATMHRVKGLEFDCVIVIDVNEGIVPLDSMMQTASDAIHRKDLEYAERSLLYVAITRAKKDVVVLTSGNKSMILN